ncbi:hypothetical protein HYV70_01975 [Candidatus Uhrbacteria bacterium]|nr:hypothetical protein [Candidatus Uhrbacteria bacterium]
MNPFQKTEKGSPEETSGEPKKGERKEIISSETTDERIATILEKANGKFSFVLEKLSDYKLRTKQRIRNFIQNFPENLQKVARDVTEWNDAQIDKINNDPALQLLSKKTLQMIDAGNRIGKNLESKYVIVQKIMKIYDLTEQQFKESEQNFAITASRFISRVKTTKETFMNWVNKKRKEISGIGESKRQDQLLTKLNKLQKIESESKSD